jgi:hypothetical protein
MPYPNLDLAKSYGFDQRVLHSYYAQLYLRKKLNEIHKMLYDPKQPQILLPPQSRDDDFNFITYLQQALDMRFVPQEFMFDPDEPPAKDILSARLRAKFWGAQVITFRPFIRQILDFNSNKRPAADSSVPVSSDFRRDVSVPMIGPDTRSENDIDPQIIAYAQKGIRALIESTRAFHNIEDKRFVITNVFGTAHAYGSTLLLLPTSDSLLYDDANMILLHKSQWGNLLTLSAVYKDPTLSKHIDERLLRDLFSRTIKFFQTIAHPSSALAIDMKILQGLDRELWHSSRNIDIQDIQAGSSFSSNTSDSHVVPPLTPSAPAPPVMHAAGGHMEVILPPPIPMHQPI